MERDLQEMERILQRISNDTVTADHVIQHIQGLYPSDKQILPSEHIKISTQLIVQLTQLAYKYTTT